MSRVAAKAQIWICLVGVIYAGLSSLYAKVWRNELTLWIWAVRHAPLKPRPHINLAIALIERGQYQDAWEQFLMVDAILATQDLPWYDREDASKAVIHDKSLLAQVLTSGPHGR